MEYQNIDIAFIEIMFYNPRIVIQLSLRRIV